MSKLDDSLRRLETLRQRQQRQALATAAETQTAQLDNHAGDSSHLSPADRTKLDRYPDPTGGTAGQFLRNAGPLAGFTVWADIDQLRGRLIGTAAPTDGQVLTFHAASQEWRPQTPSGGVGVTDGDKGDLTVSGTGTVWTIDAGAVSTSKLGGDITAAGKALLDDADPAAQRATLGLGTAATAAATDFVSATATRAANLFFAGPASGAAAAPTFRTASAPRTFGWGCDGTPAVGVVTMRTQYTADVAMTLTAISLVALTAPSGGALDIDVERWNGSTWASVFATRPTIASGQTEGGGSAVFSAATIAAGWRLRVNVFAANGAADVTIQLAATVGVI
jgi:hypothetical protein